MTSKQWSLRLDIHGVFPACVVVGCAVRCNRVGRRNLIRESVAGAFSAISDDFQPSEYYVTRLQTIVFRIKQYVMVRADSENDENYYLISAFCTFNVSRILQPLTF